MLSGRIRRFILDRLRELNGETRSARAPCLGVTFPVHALSSRDLRQHAEQADRIPCRQAQETVRRTGGPIQALPVTGCDDASPHNRVEGKSKKQINIGPFELHDQKAAAIAHIAPLWFWGLGRKPTEARILRLRSDHHPTRTLA